jgi:hypothetical protein
LQQPLNPAPSDQAFATIDHLCTSQQESLENLDESLEKPSWQLLTHSSVDRDSSKGGFNQRQLSNTMH